MQTKTDRNLDDIADHIRLVLARTADNRDQWVELTLELAAAVLEGRGKFTADQAFGKWLEAQAFQRSLNHNDRSALIKIGKLDPAKVSVELRKTETRSYQLAWRDYLAPIFGDPDVTPFRFTSASKPETQSTEPSKPVENPDKSSTTTVAKAAIKSEVRRSIPPVRPHSALLEMPRHEEVVAIYRDGDTRMTLNVVARSGRPAWSLILKAIDKGLLPRGPWQGARISAPSLRLVLPTIDGTASRFASFFDITKPQDRKRIENEIFPAVLARLDEFSRDPNSIERIVRDYAREQRRKAQEQASTGEVQRLRESLPADQREIVMFGRRLWPVVPSDLLGSYDYDALVYGISWFRDVDSDLQLSRDNSPRSRAIRIRQMTKYPMRYAETTLGIREAHQVNRMFNVVHMLCGLLDSTKGQGECKPPPYPIDVIGG